MGKEYDVIVCGGGVGGLGAAGLLAKAGKKVLLLERKKNVGGRAATFKDKDGVTHSMGQHAMLENIKYDNLLRILGVEVKKEYFSDWKLSMDGELQHIIDIMPQIPERGGEHALKMMEIVTGEVDLDELDDISCREWIDKNMPENNFLNQMMHMGTAIASTIPTLEEAAASMLYETTQLMFQSMLMWLAANGMQEVLDDMADAIRKNGGTVMTSTTVQSINFENNKITGVLASGTVHEELVEGEFHEFEEYKAPVVVCNIPVWDVLNNVIPEEKLPEDFVKKAHNITCRTANLGITALTPKPVYEGSQFLMYLFPSCGLPGSIFVPTNTCPNLAPKGKHLFESSIICNYEELRNDQKKKHEMLQGMKEDLRKLFPGWDKDAYWINSMFHYEEPKREPGKSGRHRPGNSIPEIQGLYFSGDSYGSRTVPGLECAADSAMLCAKEILGEELYDKLDEKKKK